MILFMYKTYSKGKQDQVPLKCSYGPVDRIVNFEVPSRTRDGPKVRVLVMKGRSIGVRSVDWRETESTE